ncbi:MAG: class I SAM-dependent methyltransferase [Erythrobacter sp.]
MNATQIPSANDPWGDFWSQTIQGERTVHGGGCLPQRWAAIEDAQSSEWLAFIEDLPTSAKVLDLATGDGCVLRWMHEARPDLELKGIDLAPELPAPPPQMQILTGVAMEEVPFDDNSFAAVVSQFGFEYGDVTAIAAEIARLLDDKGKVGLMVHRGDGPILEHNRQRQSEINWALREKNVMQTVASALTAPNGGNEVAAQVAAALAMLGQKTFSESSPAWEIPEAMRRSILMGEKTSRQSILDAFAAIERHAVNEVGRIDSLANACATADARDVIVGAFSNHNLSLKSTNQVCEPSGRALADFLLFS